MQASSHTIDFLILNNDFSAMSSRNFREYMHDSSDKPWII